MPIRAFTRLSRRPITIHAQIEEPGEVLVLHPILLGTVPVTEGLQENGMLLVNSSMRPAEVREMTDFHTGEAFTVNAGHTAIEEMGRDITNTPMLGAFARATGIFDTDESGEAVARLVCQDLGASR